ncbi:MAG: arylsulfatase [Blastocatellia bacterium]
MSKATIQLTYLAMFACLWLGLSASTVFAQSSIATFNGMTSTASDSLAQARQPNVLLILTDDQGWGDLRVHGNDKIDTPVLDRLAAESVSFERFFVSPLCAPTRASLLTGRYSQRTGALWVTRGMETMRSEEVTIAEALGQAGYATGVFGKWHNGAHYPHDPRGQGFGEFFGFCGGHWMNYFDTTLRHNNRDVPTKGYITDVLTDAAIRFIEKNKAERERKPFFAYVPYNAPHKPVQAPDRYFDKYKQRGLDDVMAGLYGMIENVDDNVGRLLLRLDELQLRDDTIVVYLHDNGPNGARFNGGMKGTKGQVHEGGMRSPLFMRWPGKLKAGSRVPQIAAHIDLLPTLLDLCGVALPRGVQLDGLSLVPLLKGQASTWPDRMLFAYHIPNPDTARHNPGTVRTQQHRLVITEKGAELYDMVADPRQQRDLAATEPKTVIRLRDAYEAWLKDVLKDVPKDAAKGEFARLPIPVGHEAAPLVELPAPEIAAQTGVAFKGGNGWAHDWLIGWDSVDDAISWDLSVARAGHYEITLLYSCPAADVGSRVQVEVGGQRVAGVIKRAHDPLPLPSPDREPRKEVFEKTWARLTLGSLSLGAGRTRLSVNAVSVAGKTVAELKAVQLRKVK